MPPTSWECSTLADCEHDVVGNVILPESPVDHGPTIGFNKYPRRVKVREGAELQRGKMGVGMWC